VTSGGDYSRKTTKNISSESLAQNNRSLNLQISTELTKAKSQEPAY